MIATNAVMRVTTAARPSIQGVICQEVIGFNDHSPESSLYLLELYVKIEFHFIWMRPISHGVILFFKFDCNPIIDHLVVKHAAGL